MRSNIFYFLTGIAFAAFSVTAGAQTSTVATIPEGFLAFHLPQTGSQPVATYCSIPLANDPIYSGLVGSVDDDTITSDDSPTPWTDGSFSAPGTPYFVKFMSGAQMGRVIKVVANTSSTVTLDITDNSTQTVVLDTPGFSVQPGDIYEIYAGFTLASLLGDGSTQNAVVLTGNSDPTQADTVSIYSKALLTTQSYYFNTTSNCWSLVGSTQNANNTVLYPNTDLTITRNANESALTIVVAGRVAEVPVLIKTTGCNSVVYGSTGYATDMTLSQLQYSNWIEGSWSFMADNVSVWDAALNQFDTYFQMADSTWRSSTDATTDQSNFVVAAGSQIAILKRGAVSGASSYLQCPMPYSLN